MAVRKYLARNHRFYINTVTTNAVPTPADATWVAISGVNAWSWGEDASSADSSDFDNAGWGSDFTVTRKATLGIEGQYLLDETTGTKDEGQRLAEVAAHTFGPDGFRWLKVAGLNTARTTEIGSIIVQCSINQQEGGGGMEDIQPFSIEGMVQGKPVGSGSYNIFN